MLRKLNNPTTSLVMKLQLDCKLINVIGKLKNVEIRMFKYDL